MHAAIYTRIKCKLNLYVFGIVQWMQAWLFLKSPAKDCSGVGCWMLFKGDGPSADQAQIKRKSNVMGEPNWLHICSQLCALDAGCIV